MGVVYSERPSDSPWVEGVSTVRTTRTGTVTVPAAGHSYMFVLRHEGQTSFTLGGPISTAYWLPQPANAEWMGIRLKLGTYVPHLAVLQGEPAGRSKRTVQRRLRAAVGLTGQELHHIERARRAAGLLQRGVSILDTVDAATSTGLSEAFARSGSVSPSCKTRRVATP